MVATDAVPRVTCHRVDSASWVFPNVLSSCLFARSCLGVTRHNHRVGGTYLRRLVIRLARYSAPRCKFVANTDVWHATEPLAFARLLTSGRGVTTAVAGKLVMVSRG